MITLFTSVKLQAASKSMHQFCNVVRSIYPCETRDDIVEAATGFLYLSVAGDVFGKRFRQRLRSVIRHRLKYITPEDFVARIDRISMQAEAFRISEFSAHAPIDDRAGYQIAVNGAIRSLLIEAGMQYDDAEVMRACFPRFEHAAARMQSHLHGIRNQNRWLIG
jgi:hypothetical protein